ncbi:hypothetical protein Q6A51_12570 [Pseudomonas sp. KFB-139]|uniref:Uncharacterized protein n=1 Tax=Pseudomonas serbiensis TaxID=3064350 RepID=A0ABT9CU60_9PSED|nr:hypothetical protein [Pseudomonas sp. KFB-138]MDO7927621.1 hypothetical protein [Pseudomonas sp. KFB-138]
MNISSVVSNAVKPQLPSVQASTSIPAKMTVPEAEPTLSAREARAKEFYTREEEPWKNRFYYSGSGDPDEVGTPMTKEIFLGFEEMRSASYLSLQQCYYDHFRKELIELKPELAKKGFSYTLGDDAQIKVISYENSLSEDEIKWLTDTLNNIEDFKESVQLHAKSMMILVDHDTETFGGKYNLNLMNFQDTIDYGKIVAVRKNDLSEEWIRQIEQNAEKRESPLIDIKA